jgi:hypothetical protein
MKLSLITHLLRAGMLVGLLLTAAYAYAAEPETGSASAPVEKPQLTVSGIDKFNVAHEYLSNRIETLSSRLDNFFGENRSFEESNDTYLQIRGSVILNEDETFFNGEFRTKLSLPNLSKHLRFVLESRKQDVNPTDPRITTGDPSLRDNLEGSEIFAGVELGFEEFQHWKLSLQPGLKLDRFDPTVRFRARRQSGVHDGWQNRLTLTPDWFESSGWEASVGFDLERIVLEDALFRSSSQVFWQEETEDNYNLGQLFQFINPLNRDESLAYEIGMTAHTQPELEDESYFGSVRYRRNVHQGWMFVELKPQLLFARDNDFDADPSIALTLEILIGGPYREERTSTP